ncbi:hypothetical protein [Vibrio sp. HN007]|uniref:hypothetical protein n=1 Tax=Vibrio iocasae TaxID=3098914 RepID=UPI0035D3FCC9
MKKLITECYYFSTLNFNTIFRIFGPFAIITAVLSPVIEVMSSVYEYNWVYLMYLCMFSIVHTYLMVRFIKFMASVASGRVIEQTVSFREWFDLIIVYFIYGVAVMLGMIALIIPGLYFSARYGFADFEVVLNKKKPFSALDTSWKETKGITLKLILVSVLIGGFQIVSGTILGYVGDTSMAINIVTTVLSDLISTVVMIFMSIAYFRVYVTNFAANEVPAESEA